MSLQRFVLRWLCAFGAAMLFAGGGLQPPAVWGQPPAAEVGVGDASYVPPSSLAMVLVRPQAWLGYPDFASTNQWLWPHEVMAAWGQQHLGIHLAAIAEVKVVIGVPRGNSPPPFGVVVTTLEDFDPANLSSELVDESGPITIQQRTLYPLALDDAPVRLYVDAVGPRTVLIADRLMLQAMRDAAAGIGPLAELVRNNPPGDADAQALIALGPLRPILSQLVYQLPPDTPDELRQLAGGVRLLSAVAVRLKQEGGRSQLRLETIADDAAGASELLRLTNQTLEMGKREFLATVAEELAGYEPGPVTDAWQTYYTRLANELLALVQPRQQDDRVVVETSLSPSLATTGIAAGMLIPAVQAARFASRRMQSTNNLRQIGLAMHNYHATHGHLPAAAITAADGTPLLSWRVSLLPFLEQGALYEQFRLDEPWDSEHNLPLLSQMPLLFLDPNVHQPGDREAGLTTYHIPVGERYLFQPEGTTRFADVTDGTSNTVMTLAGNEDSRMPWTSPDYLPLADAEDPLELLLHWEQYVGLLIGWGDGSVRHLSLDDVSLELFEAMLTRAGGEVFRLP